MSKETKKKYCVSCGKDHDGSVHSAYCETCYPDFHHHMEENVVDEHYKNKEFNHTLSEMNEVAAVLERVKARKIVKRYFIQVDEGIGGVKQVNIDFLVPKWSIAVKKTPASLLCDGEEPRSWTEVLDELVNSDTPFHQLIKENIEYTELPSDKPNMIVEYVEGKVECLKRKKK